MRIINLDTEINALGIPFKLLGFTAKLPPYPYGIYVDDIDVTGADDGSRYKVISHEITIELYHNTPEGLLAACETLEAWIESLPLDYRRRFLYISTEDHLLAEYTMNYTTKKKKG
jgi:hypothetical protein